MADQPRTRQELYERIRASSKEAYILEEMIRLGFWPKDSQDPDDPADEIRRRGELEGKLRALRTEGSRLQNINAIRKAAREKRLKESRQRRQENKERRLRERAERAEAWRERKKTRLDFLGEGVSGGLGQLESDAERLRRNGLPVLHTAADLAAAMGTSVGELRFLAFSRAAAKRTHYIQFTIPKKCGGKRFLSAPLPRLKAVQYWLLEHVLAPLPTHDAAHGFVPGRSIVSNARPHVAADVVVNVDLKDFFPTITYPRVKGMFRWLGYSEALATVFGLLCTEARRTELTLDGTSYKVATGDRSLPQGAPTSPAITNWICRNLDARLSHICAGLGMTYTRYADDLSFSGSSASDVGRLLRQVRHTVSNEGFAIHPDKTRVLRRGRRQEVTGIVVNEFPNLDRSTLRRFRATLFQVEKDGPDGKTWGSSPDLIAALEGFANYVAMVHPDKGADLQARTRALVQRYGKRDAPKKRPRPLPRPPAKDPEPPESGRGTQPANPPDAASAPSAEPERGAARPRRPPEPPKRDPWWKFW